MERFFEDTMYLRINLDAVRREPIYLNHRITVILNYMQLGINPGDIFCSPVIPHAKWHLQWHMIYMVPRWFNNFQLFDRCFVTKCTRQIRHRCHQ